MNAIFNRINSAAAALRDLMDGDTAAKQKEKDDAQSEALATLDQRMTALEQRAGPGAPEVQQGGQVAGTQVSNAA